MWAKLKKLYTKDHLSKSLKSPDIRLNALANIERLISKGLPELIVNPFLLDNIDKKILKVKLEKEKGYALNSAESSVINGLYKFLPYLGKSNAPISNSPQPSSLADKKSSVKVTESVRSGDKLEAYKQIANVVTDILIEKGYPRSRFELSKRLDWMPIAPKRSNFPTYWEYLADTYNLINGHNLKLDRVIELHQSELSIKLQEADIFFFEPFEMIIEYDEEQHFNQFRETTLKSEFYKGYQGFELQQYLMLSNRLVKPGSRKSGFSFLKSPDPLFPENQQDEKQDNRHRQRTFRDMMKDIAAAERGIIPLIRIPASMAGWKRKDLNKNDLLSITNYLEKLPVFSKF